MSKKSSMVFFCKECGFESSKWMGQCPGCKEWNTFVEEPVEKKVKIEKNKILFRTEPSTISQIDVLEEDRTSTSVEELDRVLGGGIVKGSLVLVGGDPGIGKSTLLLQVCKNISSKGKKVLYISGEESLKQIKLRAERIGEFTENLFFFVKLI
jgi:DNA repair protein RadA/Sms